MPDFGTDAAGVAMLASSYFWGYTLMQIPAGLLVDRYGVKRVVLASMAASSLGSAAFALAPNLLDVFIARLIVACGDALVFTAMLKLVAQSFSDQRFGIMSGISQVSGYVGGAMATTPLAAAVTGFGWRACFIFIACVGIANLAFASMALRPDPARIANRTIKSVLAEQLAGARAKRELGLRDEFCLALRRRHHAIGRVGHPDGRAYFQYLAVGGGRLPCSLSWSAMRSDRSFSAISPIEWLPRSTRR